MIVTAHQPEFMPWPGFFFKMHRADLFVMLDDVQFEKNNFQNRNKIHSQSHGETWLTIPVEHRGYLNKTFREIRISSAGGQARRDKVWRGICHSYGRHTYFDYYQDELGSLISRRWDSLYEQNLSLINFFRHHWNISTPIVESSSLNANGFNWQRLLNIAVISGASEYLSGPSGRTYLELNAFHQAGVSVSFSDFDANIVAEYGLRPFLSSLDLLMNLGPKAEGIIKGQRRSFAK